MVRELDLVAFICQPLDKFYKHKVAKDKSFLDVKIKDGYIVIRADTTSCILKTQMTLTDAIHKITTEGHFTNFNEVTVNDQNKMYFDIEHTHYKISIYALKREIQAVI